MNHSDYTRLFLALATDVSVTAHADGSITTTGLSLDPEVVEQRWLPQGNGLFREAGGGRLIAFADRDRRVVLFDGASAFERLAWYEQASTHLAVAGVGLLLMLLGCLAWPVLALVRRLRRRDPIAQPRPARYARFAAATTALLVVAFIVALFTLLADPTAFMIAVLAGAPVVNAVFIPLGLATLGGFAVLTCTVLAWWKGWWSRMGAGGLHRGRHRQRAAVRHGARLPFHDRTARAAQLSAAAARA
jgi:hypothetical protein